MKYLILVLFLFLPSIVSAGDWNGHEQLLVDHPTIQKLYVIHCEHRDNNGQKPQELNGELCRAAQEWSEYMAEHNYFEHSHYSVVENIALGSSTARGTMNQWIGSGGHNANLLGGAKQVGFGVAESADGTRYWTSCHGNGFKQTVEIHLESIKIESESVTEKIKKSKAVKRKPIFRNY